MKIWPASRGGHGCSFDQPRNSCIYYGTEVLMKETANHGVIREDFSGGWPGDPTDKFTAEGRSAQENQVFDLIRTLSRFRREHPKLFRGEFVHFIPQEGLYIYFRRGGEQTMMRLQQFGRSTKDRLEPIIGIHRSGDGFQEHSG